MMDKNLTRLRRLQLIYGLVVLLVVLSISACGDFFDNIISVEVPDRVVREVLDDPAHASLFGASVQGSFECALSSAIVANGAFTDELIVVHVLAGGYHAYDRRDPSPAGGLTGAYAMDDCTGGGFYTPLSTARWFADDLLAKLDRWTDAQVPKRQALLARTAAYAGYSLILLGEAMCSATLDIGPELAPAQLFEQAEARFDRAITAAQTAGTSDVLNMARVGRARARINQGKGAGAVEDARAVPRDFVFLATRAAGHATRENAVFVGVTRTRGISVGVEEPFRDVTWQGVPDPRVPVVASGVTVAGIPYFDQRKYNNEAASIPIARWEEAQLIIAEVQGGQTAIDIINDVHARARIPAFSANASDAAAIRAQVIEERRREFFLEGHRAGDRRRFKLPLIPPVGTPFPFGGVYGSSVCYPLPDVTRNNNPNIR